MTDDEDVVNPLLYMGIKKNYIYNLIYQIFLLLTPLITTPYLSRILGADGVGMSSFAESIVSYFMLFATLGINTFGQREISYVKDDRIKRTQVFWDTKALQFITSSFVLVIYIFFAIFQEHKTVYIILTFNILAILVDVVWLLQGMEEFGKIVQRNIIIKITSILYIFIMVKTHEDINKYIFGNAFFMFFGNLSLWVYVFKYVDMPFWKLISPFKYLRDTILLFIPTIAVQIYTVLDKTMIGLITRDPFEIGYYEQAIKLTKMILVIVTSLGTVMIPRIGYHFGKGEIDQVRAYTYRGYRFVWFMGIPLGFGLLGIASIFVPWFFGDGFHDVIILLEILSPLIVILGISNVTGAQYFIAIKRQNMWTVSVVFGAVTNVVLNCIFISKFKSAGAAIASVAAEFLVLCVQLYLIKRDFSIKRIIGSGCHYFWAGVTMLFVLLLMKRMLRATILNTIALIMIGAIVYFAVLLLLRDSFLKENLKSFYKLISFVDQQKHNKDNG